MSSEIRHAAIREIEKAGGTVRCAIRDGESVVTVTDRNGVLVKAKNAFGYDLEEALTLYRGAKGRARKAAEAIEAPRRRPKARTLVVARETSPSPHTGQNPAPRTPETDRLSLKERLKLRNQEKVA